MKHGRILPSLALLALGMAASSCNDIMTAGGSDEIDTSVGRVAVDRAGTPVAFARVALVRSEDSTGKALAVGTTDSAGSLPTFRVPDGFYGMLLRDPGDTLGRFVDSLEVKSGVLPSGRDTLLALGSVHGRVRVAPGHSPATVALGLVGTDILANVHEDGSFWIELVPGGVYTLSATSSLKGYEPLYRRIQLRIGQDLILPDTLILSFTGLPAPVGLGADQDTATGDVRVRWNSVENPDLYGYIVEVLEGGAVTRSRFTRDSVWTDSIGKDWTSGALLGPWPDRPIVYRVSSRSKSGAEDARSAGLEFVAHPPAWTASMDSVTLRIDTLEGGATRISWPSLPHPALVGWKLERRTGGSVDCEMELGEGDTSGVDSLCPEWGWRKIDSGSTGWTGSRGLYRADTTTWTLFARRVHGVFSPIQGQERLAVATLAPPAGPVFEGQAVGSWSRTVEKTFEQAYGGRINRLRGVGSWLVHVVGYPRPWQDDILAISLDGRAWESVGKSGLAVGRGDSLWILRPRSDSLGVAWERRVGVGAWVSDSIALPVTVGRVNWAVRDAQGFVVGVEHPRSIMTGDYRSIRIGASGWQVLDSAMDDEPAQIVSAMILDAPGGGYDILVGSYYPGNSAYRHADVPPARVMYSQENNLVAIGPSVPLGIWGQFPSSLFWAAPSTGSGESDLDARLALADSSGNAQVVRLPEGAAMPALRGDELWVPVGDALWKGTIVTKR